MSDDAEYSARDVAMAVRRLDLMMSQMHLEMCERLGLSAAELLALAHLSRRRAAGADRADAPAAHDHRRHDGDAGQARGARLRRPRASRHRPPPHRRPSDQDGARPDLHAGARYGRRGGRRRPGGSIRRSAGPSSLTSRTISGVSVGAPPTVPRTAALTPARDIVGLAVAVLGTGDRCAERRNGL